MVMVITFLIALFILSGYILLFWLVRRGFLSVWGAVIMVSISLVCYFIFPHMLKNMEIQSVTMFLFIFISLGIVLVLAFEDKIEEQRKLYFNIDIPDITQILNKLDLSKRIDFLKSKFRFRGFNMLKIKSEQAADGMAEDVIPVTLENENILDDFNNDENSSYVDFNRKAKKLDDVFSKYIRGEIALSDVSKKILKRDEEQDTRVNQEQSQANEVHESGQNLFAAVIEEEVGDKEFKGQQDDIKNQGKSIGDDGSLTIEQCIDKAFESKSKGLLLEAVESYIEALDKRPEDQLILWIVVDICSLYKQMGQDNLAKEMMQSYLETFGHTLSAQGREELTKNFDLE